MDKVPTVGALILAVHVSVSDVAIVVEKPVKVCDAVVAKVAASAAPAVDVTPAECVNVNGLKLAPEEAETVAAIVSCNVTGLACIFRM